MEFVLSFEAEFVAVLGLVRVPRHQLHAPGARVRKEERRKPRKGREAKRAPERPDEGHEMRPAEDRKGKRRDEMRREEKREMERSNEMAEEPQRDCFQPLSSTQKIGFPKN